MPNQWSNLAAVVYSRTYSRNDTGVQENWDRTVERYIAGNVTGFNVAEEEIKRLLYFGKERKAIPAGRGLWFSGAPSHKKVGGAALCNCYFISGDDWTNLILAMDLLMLGGGVGLSIEQRFVSKLPKVKPNVVITHLGTNDADFIVPDSREGWCKLFWRVLESYFVTGKSFTYSTVCLRGYGELIKGFGGVASGPQPLIQFIKDISSILNPRAAKHVRSIDAMDLICCTGKMVVSGNVRRSAIIILGDPWDKEFLKSKRWSLGNIPSWRSCANLSVVTDDIENDLNSLYWKTFEDGEAFGIINRKNIQQFGRSGEKMLDSAIGVNPCGEATLESGEPCNLQEIALMNISGEEEFIEASKLMHRYGKRVTCEKFHDPRVDEVVKRNRRIGTGITGCLGSELFNPYTLDRGYEAIQEENRNYSKFLNIPESIRTTVIKPSGTVSKVLDQAGYEGIHAAYSQYIIQRIRFSSNDSMLPMLRAAGHYMEPVVRFDGSLDQSTIVVDFYVKSPDGMPVADKNWDTWKQLDAVKMANKYWADQSVSCSIYYKKDDIPKIKEWLRLNWCDLKTISFLCHSDHGFKQAPKETITEKQFNSLSKKIKPLNLDGKDISGEMIEGLECSGGSCPIR